MMSLSDTKKEEVRLNTPSSVQESLGCARYHTEDGHCGHSHQRDSPLKCKAGLPTDLTADEALNSEEAKGVLGGKS